MQFIKLNIQQEAASDTRQKQPTGQPTQIPAKPTTQSGQTFLQRMMQNAAPQTKATGSVKPELGENNPFSSSASAMFSDFEKMKNETTNVPEGKAAKADLPPGMQEADLDNLEK